MMLLTLMSQGTHMKAAKSANYGGITPIPCFTHGVGEWAIDLAWTQCGFTCIWSTAKHRGWNSVVVLEYTHICITDTMMQKTKDEIDAI